MAAAQFSISPNVRSTFNDVGGVLLNENTGAVYCLSTVGSQVWFLLEGSEQGLSFDAISQAVIRDWDVPRQRLLVELRAFMKKLEAEGLVQASEGTQANRLTVN